MKKLQMCGIRLFNIFILNIFFYIIMYKQKYLKYKEKYLILKGGTYEQLEIRGISRKDIQLLQLIGISFETVVLYSNDELHDLIQNIKILIDHKVEFEQIRDDIIHTLPLPDIMESRGITSYQTLKLVNPSMAEKIERTFNYHAAENGLSQFDSRAEDIHLSYDFGDGIYDSRAADYRQSFFDSRAAEDRQSFFDSRAAEDRQSFFDSRAAEDRQSFFDSRAAEEIDRINDTFYIYTTGINDKGYTYSNLRLLWISGLRDKILSRIPNIFTKIIIIHYDKGDKGAPDSGDNMKEFEELMLRDEIYIKADLPYTSLDKPHIIIDMAHIFGYYPNDSKDAKFDTYFSDYYNDYKKPDYKLYGNKAITFGYMRDDIASSNLINVYVSGKVITFIDKLIEFKLIGEKTIEIASNIDTLVNIYIKEKLYTISRQKQISWGDVQDILTKYNLCSMFINKLLICETKEDLDDLSTYEGYYEILREIDELA